VRCEKIYLPFFSCAAPAEQKRERERERERDTLTYKRLISHKELDLYSARRSYSLCLTLHSPSLPPSSPKSIMAAAAAAAAAVVRENANMKYENEDGGVIKVIYGGLRAHSARHFYVPVHQSP
jgi:hypothetical protein